MSSTTHKLRTSLATATAVLGLAAAPAGAQDVQPADPGCSLQGGGTPCTLQNGESQAPADTSAQDGALSWARAQMGSTAWDGYCLQFTADAYSAAGVDITAYAGAHGSAVEYWDTYTGTKHPPSTAPEKGALVFWAATDSNPAGHVAISNGDGTAVSTDERSYPGVHDMTIANRDAQGYTQLGWVIPGR